MIALGLVACVTTCPIDATFKSISFLTNRDLKNCSFSVDETSSTLRYLSAFQNSWFLFWWIVQQWTQFSLFRFNVGLFRSAVKLMNYRWCGFLNNDNIGFVLNGCDNKFVTKKLITFIFRVDSTICLTSRPFKKVVHLVRQVTNGELFNIIFFQILLDSSIFSWQMSLIEFWKFSVLTGITAKLFFHPSYFAG